MFKLFYSPTLAVAVNLTNAYTSGPYFANPVANSCIRRIIHPFHPYGLQ